MKALAKDQRFTLARDLRHCAELAGVERFDLDVAACREAHVCPRYFTVRDNGLRKSWYVPQPHGKHSHTRVWCNPPFSDIAPWIVKAWQAMADGECATVAMLIPATRTEQPWWQRLVEPFRDSEPRRMIGEDGFTRTITLRSHFLPGRTRFGKPGNPKALGVAQVGKGLGVGSPDFTCVLLVWKRLQTSAGGRA